MKCFEQKLGNLSVIFLHDPFKCFKCIDMMNFEDFCRTFNTCLPKAKVDDYFFYKCVEPYTDLSGEISKESIMDPKFLSQKPCKQLSPKTKVLKRKNTKNIYSKAFQALPVDSCKINYPGPVKNSQKYMKKNTSVKDVRISPTKKQSNSPVKKREGSKMPGRGTLRRRRLLFQQLKDKNDNYEDDLFENQKFPIIQKLFQDETDNIEKYQDFKTPVFPISISPREESPSPTYKDCYSPTEWSRCRKGAEVYHYRRTQRRKSKPSFAFNKAEAPKVNPQRRESDVLKRLEEVARILNKQKEMSSDSEDDQYFSDVLDDNSTKVNP